MFEALCGSDINLFSAAVAAAQLPPVRVANQSVGPAEAPPPVRLPAHPLTLPPFRCRHLLLVDAGSFEVIFWAALGDFSCSRNSAVALHRQHLLSVPGRLMRVACALVEPLVKESLLWLQVPAPQL